GTIPPSSTTRACSSRRSPAKPLVRQNPPQAARRPCRSRPQQADEVAVPVPETNFSPAFNITRASHIALTVRDLGASRAFYTEVIGLLVTHEGDGELHLRGVEESCHHSLVLRQSPETPCCERIGF